MLISIVLELESEKDGVLPGELGHAGYAAFLARLNQVHPTLASELHNGSGPKPLTCSGLLDGRPGQAQRTLRRGQRAQVRITGLTAAVGQALLDVLVDHPPSAWSLHDHPFRVLDSVCDANVHPWSGQTDYERLAAQAMAQVAHLPRQVTLEFTSPTSFKLAEGMHMPLPMPALVFGSLAERWNAFSPLALSAELRQFCQSGLAISAFRLSSVPVNQKGNALRIGGQGRVSYRVLCDDPYYLAAINMLADFALYSGVGIQTTMGMGQVRRLAPRSDAPGPSGAASSRT